MRPPTGTVDASAQASPPILAQVAGMSARIDCQETMLEAILTRLKTSTPSHKPPSYQIPRVATPPQVNSTPNSTRPYV
jgi:hypothetical protein